MTLSSGVKGYTTIHAGSARQALTRLRFMCQLADTSSPLPLGALSSLVTEAVDLVVHCARTGGRPWVREIVAVEDQHGPAEAGAFTVTDVFTRSEPDEALAWTGNVPQRAGRLLEAAGFDVVELIGVPGGTLAAGARA